jgi:hypothetical protein
MGSVSCSLSVVSCNGQQSTDTIKIVSDFDIRISDFVWASNIHMSGKGN